MVVIFKKDVVNFKDEIKENIVRKGKLHDDFDNEEGEFKQ